MKKHQWHLYVRTHDSPKKVVKSEISDRHSPVPDLNDSLKSPPSVISSHWEGLLQDDSVVENQIMEHSKRSFIDDSVQANNTNDMIDEELSNTEKI